MSNNDLILKMTTHGVSKLAFRTCFSSISFNGYKLDILKSAVQKYLRRREFDKMVWCVAEIYLFQVYAKTDVEKRATKGIISNLFHMEWPKNSGKIEAFPEIIDGRYFDLLEAYGKAHWSQLVFLIRLAKIIYA